MGAGVRRRVFAGLAGAAAIGAVGGFDRFVVRFGSPAGGLVMFSAIVAILTVAWLGGWWPRSRDHAASATTGVAMVSLLVTLAYEPQVAPRDAFWIVGEAAAILSLITLVMRWTPLGRARLVGALAGLAMTMTLARVNAAPFSLEAMGAFVAWAGVAGGAAALGLYLRALDANRARMIGDARRSQRLELARDLHDFVAHDVTGMVVQAQAALAVAHRNPHEAITALQRIEESGQHALGSLDRTVRMLGDLSTRPGEAPKAPVFDEPSSSARTLGLRDVFELVGRYTASDRTPVHLHVGAAIDEGVPREVSSTAYRVVVEALTNVRRHAPGASRVSVSITAGQRGDARMLTVRVTNEMESGRDWSRAGVTPHDHRDGTGLIGLAERVEAVGGELAAGPLDDGARDGWHVTVVLPVSRSAR